MKVTTRTTKTERPSWPAVGAVATGTFTVVTTEMVPVGLLPAVERGFSVSAGTAGLTMTVPGLVAAVAAPALTVAAGRRDRRTVLLALVALLTAANLLSAVAPAFWVLLTARVLVGVAIGGVWAIAAGVAVRLVPERSAGTATSLVFSGIAVASVLGVPAGTLVGEAAGWRAAFGALAVLSLLVLLASAVLLPPLPAAQGVRPGEVPALLRERGVRAGLAVTVLLVVAHFAAFTYVRPALEDVAHVAPHLVSALLLAYGVAGVLGNFAGGAGAARDPRRTALVLGLAVAASVALLPVGGVGALIAWGLAYGGVSVTLQTWMTRAVPWAPEAGAALFVAAFNVAISLGALVGGRVVDGAGVTAVLWTAAALAAAAAVAAGIARNALR
ncbi:MFS transporter [Actinomadura kijaniata]|uniref:Putative MFS family arabinose efflux permease n=1 Tax=Actinomadura namibiensis TaxID=182080 RepID=A0A7W3LWJ5_ACTNM|nr:MFS transporter [Actinomadura namibiensis]MBA8955636.1 putative MFS family arabinose efflux permease [Actinomadura namibiensis]